MQSRSSSSDYVIRLLVCAFVCSSSSLKLALFLCFKIYIDTASAIKVRIFEIAVVTDFVEVVEMSEVV